MNKRSVASVLAVTACACAHTSSAPHAEGPPVFLIGEFVDDYGSRYSIEPDLWTHGLKASYHILSWHVADQFAVVQNDTANSDAGGLWTRIDWVALDGSDGYEWGYCYAAYDAATQAAAVAATPSARETPRTGCNGFPFSRMRRVQADTALGQRDSPRD